MQAEETAARRGRHMSNAHGPHDWLVHVLEDLSHYALEHDLPRIAHALDSARQAVELSGRSRAEAARRTVERAWFVDTVRDLIDYAGQNGLTETERHLMLSLELAPQEWERAERLRLSLSRRDGEGDGDGERP